MSNIIYGNPGGIKEGTCFPSRAALIKAGLHRFTVHGIDGNGTDGVSAIVLSGGYEDDVDYGDEIIYTGHGGNNPATKKQVEHQSWESPGNQGLIISKRKNIPIRVIRGHRHNSVFSPKSGYKYCGLFKVEDFWDEMGKGGFIICRFKLLKINLADHFSYNSAKKGALVKLQAEGKEAKWFSIGVDAPNAQKICADSKMAQLFSGKKAGELIDFGIGFKILEIRKYLSH